jgi:hypothetical protein
MEGFKLIGIRIYNGFDKNISKNLTPNTLYTFYQGFIFKDDEGMEIPQNQELPIGEGKVYVVQGRGDVDLSSLYSRNNSNLKVNISAIVGKNGSGKSAMVDTFMYILYLISIYSKEYKGTTQEFGKGLFSGKT